MNKELLGKIEAFFLMPLILIYYVLLSKRVINLIISDICVSEMPKVSFWSFAYNFSIHEDFRSTVYIRLGWKRIFVSWMKPGAKCFYNLTKHYGDSLFIQHGFATVVYAKSVGHHFFVNQQVTIGFGDDGNPTIGNYVSVRAGIVAKLKADAEQRTAQLRSIVEQMMTKQGVAIGTADDMWKFLAKGDFTVSADVKAQAQADIADDGYWGVEQTSDRILDFAKALSGDDPDKADAMLEAFKKGFEQATKAWGDKLPDISQRTYDAVVEKFNKWKNGTEDASTEA